MGDSFSLGVRLRNYRNRSLLDWARFRWLAALAFATGSLLWNVVLAAPAKPKKPSADAPPVSAEASDKDGLAQMIASGEKDLGDVDAGTRQPNDPPDAKLTIQDAFAVDQPVTSALLTALKTPPPAQKRVKAAATANPSTGKGEPTASSK